MKSKILLALLASQAALAAPVKPGESRPSTQARCVPNMKSGKIEGYRCFRIEPGSAYARLGLRDNDLITRVDDDAVDAPHKLLRLYQKLEAHEKVSFTIEREGRLITKTMTPKKQVKK